jgi:AcrR family transcriptional regulator
MAKTNPQILRSRRALREGLLALLERKKVDEITVQELATKAGVGYATFFRHYASTEQLLAEIAAEEIRQMMEIIVPLEDPKDTLAACVALCEYIDARRAVWAALLKNADRALRAEFVRHAALRHPPKIRKKAPFSPELGARVGVAATMEIVSWWLERRHHMTPAQAAAVLDRLVVAPAIGER